MVQLPLVLVYHGPENYSPPKLKSYGGDRHLLSQCSFFSKIPDLVKFPHLSSQFISQSTGRLISWTPDAGWPAPRSILEWPRGIGFHMVSGKIWALKRGWIYVICLDLPSVKKLCQKSPEKITIQGRNSIEIWKIQVCIQIDIEMVRFIMNVMRSFGSALWG